MKNIKLLSIVIVFSAAVTAAWGQQYVAPVEYIPAAPTPGRQATVVYKPELTELAGADKIEGIVYLWDNSYTWTGVDLDMTRVDTAWVAVFDVPEKTSLLFTKFYADGKSDTGGRNTYGTMTLTEEGRNPAGAYAGWGLARNPNTQQYSIPGYVTDSMAMIGDDVLLYWFNSELRFHPEERIHVSKYAIETMHRMQREGDDEKIKGEMGFLLTTAAEDPDFTEEQYLEILDIARRILNDNALAGELEKEILERYPDGIMARDAEIVRIARIPDMSEKSVALARFLERFPAEKFVDVKSEMGDKWLSDIFRGVVYNPIVTDRDYTLLYEYIDDVPYGLLTTFFWHLVQIPYQNEDKAFAIGQLRECADLIVGEIMNRPPNRERRAYSPRQREEQIYERNRDAMRIYAEILSKTGDTEKAAMITERVKPYFGYGTTDFNDFYITVLQETGRDSEVTEFIEGAVKQNAASPEMLAILEQNYKGDDFDAYLTELKTDKLAAQRARLDQEIVDLPIELFALEKLGGGTVDMAALKGKILVLDFWATWCAPCKAAMPGMNMALQKYADDDGVEFFFVSTMESANRGDYKQEIRDFLAEKGFGHFTVLLDTETTGGRQKDLVYSTYAREFRFSGIPQKMIIDGNGRLRWRSTGYHGSPSELADEISYLIEKLKSE